MLRHYQIQDANPLLLQRVIDRSARLAVMLRRTAAQYHQASFHRAPSFAKCDDEWCQKVVQELDNYAEQKR